LKVPKNEEKAMENLKLTGATGNNLKNVSIEFPLGKLICVTGVSGSGKSTLINETLYPILNEFYFNGVKKPYHSKKLKD
jgi:excinuclease ABC subunit A